MKLNNKHQFLASLVILAVACASGLQGAQATEERQLDRRIGPAISDKYKTIRDAQDWLNPYLSVCSQGVIVAVRSIRRDTRTVPIAELRQTLLDLPVLGWPYGRIVALQDCSIGVPGDEQERRRRMRDVEAALKTLGLEINRWPS